jgi:anti-anti-sigma factor
MAATEKDRGSFAGHRRFALRGFRQGEAQLLVLEGELDVATASELALAIEVAEATSASAIVVDLRGLEFIDSSGLHVVVDARHRVGERLILVRGARCVHRVFERCGLVECLAFVDAPARIAASRPGEPVRTSTDPATAGPYGGRGTELATS